MARMLIEMQSSLASNLKLVFEGNPLPSDFKIFCVQV